MLRFLFGLPIRLSLCVAPLLTAGRRGCDPKTRAVNSIAPLPYIYKHTYVCAFWGDTNNSQFALAALVAPEQGPFIRRNWKWN